MAQINVKGVSEELNHSLEAAAKGLGVSKSMVIVRAIELFVEKYSEFVQKGERLMESSPLRKG